MSEFKVGDRVWVLCEVAVVYKDRADLYMDIRHDCAVFEAKASDCRPVEPAAKESTPAQKLAERTMKAIWAANDSVNGTPVIKECLTTESNSPEIPDSSSKLLRVGDAVRFVWPGHKHHRAKGVVKSITKEDGEYLFESDCGQFGGWFSSDQIERLNQVDPINPSHYKQGGIECIEAIKAALGDGFPDYLRGNVMKYLWRYKEKGGVDDLRKSAWYLDRLFKEVSE